MAEEKLKTLKDLEKLNLRRFNEYSAYLISEDDERWELFDGKDVIPFELLKQEAIRWIKELEQQIDTLLNKKLSIDVQLQRQAQIDWIKHFFNITDEDLK